MQVHMLCSAVCAAGYNYYGNERMYSGLSGREFEADIFFGVVYYQRLRHMVSDKFQVNVKCVCLCHELEYVTQQHEL